MISFSSFRSEPRASSPIGGKERASTGTGCGSSPEGSLALPPATLREELERCHAVHVCRENDCSQPGAVHCKAYAAVDSDVDLGAYGRFGGWRCFFFGEG